MLEVEALRADAAAAGADLDLLAGSQLGAEIDLDAREDELQRARREPRPGLLEVRRVDGVVHMPHRIAVAEPDAFAPDEGELAHRRIVCGREDSNLQGLAPNGT